MMSRFVVSRRVFSFACSVVLLANALLVSTPPALAQEDWSSILKPFVQDVLLPGARLGVKKWQERKGRRFDTSGEQSIEAPLPDAEESSAYVQMEEPPPPEEPFSSSAADPPPPPPPPSP